MFVIHLVILPCQSRTLLTRDCISNCRQTHKPTFTLHCISESYSHSSSSTSNFFSKSFSSIFLSIYLCQIFRNLLGKTILRLTCPLPRSESILSSFAKLVPWNIFVCQSTMVFFAPWILIPQSEIKKLAPSLSSKLLWVVQKRQYLCGAPFLWIALKLSVSSFSNQTLYFITYLK